MKDFIWPIRVYYEDTDSSGLVYYANYLKFMERARSEWLRSLGFEQDVLARDDKIVFVVRAMQLEYLRPARFNDLLQVNSQIKQVRRVSLVFQQKIINSNNELLCQGQIQVACVQVDRIRPQQIPQPILAEILVDH